MFFDWFEQELTPMRNRPAVDVFECLKELIHNILCFALTKPIVVIFVMCDVGEQISTSAEFEKNVPICN